MEVVLDGDRKSMVFFLSWGPEVRLKRANPSSQYRPMSLDLNLSLCLAEKFLIIKAEKSTLLNKRSENDSIIKERFWLKPHKSRIGALQSSKV